MRTVPPIDTMTKRNFITENRSEDWEGKMALKIRVKRPLVEDRMLTTGALVKDNANWYEY